MDKICFPQLILAALCHAWSVCGMFTRLCCDGDRNTSYLRCDPQQFILVPWYYSTAYQCIVYNPPILLEPAAHGMGAPQAEYKCSRNHWEPPNPTSIFHFVSRLSCGVHWVSTKFTPSTGRARSNRYFSIFKWTNVMSNFEIKKDCVCETAPNLALN